MSIGRVPLKLSLLPAFKAYACRTVVAPYASKVLVAPRINGTDDTTEDEIVDVDQTAVVDDDEGLPLRAPPYRVASSVVRRPWVATQDDAAVKFRMDMPGLSREDVRVYLDDGKLVIRGKHPEPPNVETQNDDILNEDNFGRYDAEILLPENVKADQIKSEMKHGVLHVTAPKEVTSILVE